MIRAGPRTLGCCALWALVVCGCGCGRDAPLAFQPSSAAIQPAGREVARVGGESLHLGEVDRLARLAGELRRELGLVTDGTTDARSFEDRLDRAVELLALSVEAQNRQVGGPKLEELTKRLLVRVYLDRLLDPLAQEPISAKELAGAHRQEMERYLTTRDSEIFRPSTVDVAAIRIGFFPDFHPPEDDEEPVIDRVRAEQLAGEIRRACGHRIADLDEFLEVGRRFMAGNPTVHLQEFQGVYLDPALASMPPELHRAIVSLKDNGAIGDPVWTQGGVFVVRRGVLHPGTGERMEEVSDQLRQRVLLDRKREAFREHMNRLKQRYRVRTWVDRLREREGRPGE